MGFTNFPNGITCMGAPVPGNYYAGWWGKNVWYVDDDTGGDEVTRNGNSPRQALKTIQEAITRASYHDTIFLKPREIDQDTHSSHGYYTGTNIIPANKTGLAIIGTGRGAGIGSAVQCMVEPDASSSDVAITVRSPGVCIENVGVKAVLSSNGAIYANVSTAQAYGLTVSNCFFKSFQTAAVGMIHTETTHWTTIQHCTFLAESAASTAIRQTSLIAAARNNTIRDCDFNGDVANISCDIWIGDSWGLLIDNCRFNHASPTGGSNVYIVTQGSLSTDHGLISNCYFPKASVTVSHFITLMTGILDSHCYGDGEIIAT